MGEGAARVNPRLGSLVGPRCVLCIGSEPITTFSLAIVCLLLLRPSFFSLFLFAHPEDRVEIPHNAKPLRLPRSGDNPSMAGDARSTRSKRKATRSAEPSECEPVPASVHCGAPHSGASPFVSVPIPRSDSDSCDNRDANVVAAAPAAKKGKERAEDSNQLELDSQGSLTDLSDAENDASSDGGEDEDEQESLPPSESEDEPGEDDDQDDEYMGSKRKKGSPAKKKKTAAAAAGTPKRAKSGAQGTKNATGKRLEVGRGAAIPKARRVGTGAKKLKGVTMQAKGAGSKEVLSINEDNTLFSEYLLPVFGSLSLGTAAQSHDTPLQTLSKIPTQPYRAQRRTG